MKHALILSFFLIVSLVLNLNMINLVNSPDPIRHYLDLELENLYGFRGEQINLTAYSSYSDIGIHIFDPIDSLIYNQTWSANESRLLPIQQDALFGEYSIYGYIPNYTSLTWFNVVDNANFSPISFPFYRLHNNAEYYVFANRSFRISYNNKSFGFTLPEMPNVNINCFNNSDIFIARFTSAIVNIDLSLIFVHVGAKLVINGTMQNGFDSFSFRFYSPQQIRNWGNRIDFINPNILGNDPIPLYFDWTDFIRTGEHLSYNQSSNILTVFDIPEVFYLDPVIGNNEVESGTEGYENYDEGNRFQVIYGSGNITSFSIRCRVTSGSDDIGVAIYNDNASHNPWQLLWNDSRTISHTSFRWENFTVLPQVQVTNSSYYHFLHNKEPLVEVQQNSTEGEGDPESVYDFRTYAMPFLSSFPVSHNDHAYLFSIYCDYTITGAQNVSYVLSETFAITELMILGIEKSFFFNEYILTPTAILLLEEKIFNLPHITTITELNFISLEMFFVTYTIFETVTIPNSILLFEEKLFNLPHTTIITESNIIELAMTIRFYTIFETAIVTSELIFEEIEIELTLNDVYTIAILGFILAVFAIAFIMIKDKDKAF